MRRSCQERPRKRRTTASRSDALRRIRDRARMRTDSEPHIRVRSRTRVGKPSAFGRRRSPAVPPAALRAWRGLAVDPSLRAWRGLAVDPSLRAWRGLTVASVLCGLPRHCGRSVVAAFPAFAVDSVFAALPRLCGRFRLCGLPRLCGRSVVASLAWLGVRFRAAGGQNSESFRQRRS